MTTAARPTFDPARGGQGRGEKDLSAISKQYSSRDLPSHTKLKYREHGQGTAEELRSRDFRKDLEEREFEKAPRKAESRESKRPRIEQAPAASLDADDPLEEEEDSDDNDSEDDTAALMAELNRIKKERAQENAKREAERRQEEERIRMENILSGNPLLNYSAQSARADVKVGCSKVNRFLFKYLSINRRISKKKKWRENSKLSRKKLKMFIFDQNKLCKICCAAIQRIMSKKPKIN